MFACYIRKVVKLVVNLSAFCPQQRYFFCLNIGKGGESMVRVERGVGGFVPAPEEARRLADLDTARKKVRRVCGEAGELICPTTVAEAIIAQLTLEKTSNNNSVISY